MDKGNSSYSLWIDAAPWDPFECSISSLVVALSTPSVAGWTYASTIAPTDFLKLLQSRKWRSMFVLVAEKVRLQKMHFELIMFIPAVWLSFWKNPQRADWLRPIAIWAPSPYLQFGWSIQTYTKAFWTNQFSSYFSLRCKGWNTDRDHIYSRTMIEIKSKTHWKKQGANILAVRRCQSLRGLTITFRVCYTHTYTLKHFKG